MERLAKRPDENKRHDPALRQKIADGLHSDREHLDQARVHAEFALEELRHVTTFNVPDGQKGHLSSLITTLAWYVKFLRDQNIDPESIYVHNLAAFSD